MFSTVQKTNNTPQASLTPSQSRQVFKTLNEVVSKYPHSCLTPLLYNIFINFQAAARHHPHCSTELCKLADQST